MLVEKQKKTQKAKENKSPAKKRGWGERKTSDFKRVHMKQKVEKEVEIKTMITTTKNKYYVEKEKRKQNQYGKVV